MHQQKTLILLFLGLLTHSPFIGPCASAADTTPGARPIAVVEGNRGWLDNGVVKVAVDQTYGGAIVFAAPSESDTNLINVHDKGRQIQQSYYAGRSLNRQSDGQSPHWSPWAWNPVQAGNFDGDGSVVLNFEPVENATVFYTRCQPRLWDMDEELAQCHFSQWLQFEEAMDNVIRVTNTLECFRDPNDRWGPAVPNPQELPAVYAIRNLSRLVIYDGDKPWTGAPLTTVRYGPADTWIWTKRKPTEPWAACVDPDTTVGIGIYSPAGAGSTWNMGWVGKGSNNSTGTEYSAPTMHVAPIATWKLDRRTRRTYRYWIIIGPLDDIRAKVYQLHTRFPEGSPGQD